MGGTARSNCTHGHPNRFAAMALVSPLDRKDLRAEFKATVLILNPRSTEAQGRKKNKGVSTL